MPLMISNEELQKLGMTEKELRIELACRLFDIGKLHLWPAAQFAGLNRVEMEGELLQRKIPIYRPTVEDLEQDLAAIKRFRS
jgi:predicted HTH domain antitoxin